MLRILGLELKRILKTRLTWLLLASALPLSALLAWLPVTFCYSVVSDEAGAQVEYTGLASIAYEKERQADCAGAVTPQRVRAAVEAYQDCLRRYGVSESYDLPEGVYDREILPLAPLLHGVKEAFADPDTGMAPPLTEVDPEALDDYYAACEARLDALMAMERPDDPAARRQAAELYRQVEKPFQVYPGSGATAMDYQNIMGFLVLLLCVVMAAPVFSDDRQTGAGDILRCTRYGRTHLAAAKVAASLLVSAAAFTVCAVTYILVSNSLFGWECTKTSIQMVYSIVTLADLNMGALQWLFAAAGLLSVLASVSLTLFLSSVSRNTMTSLAAALLLCIAPTVLYLTAPGPLAAWLGAILPAGGTGIQTSFLYAITDFTFLRLGSLSVWTPWVILAACAVEIPLFSLLAVRSHHQAA